MEIERVMSEGLSREDQGVKEAEELQRRVSSGIRKTGRRMDLESCRGETLVLSVKPEWWQIEEREVEGGEHLNQKLLLLHIQK